MRTKLLPTVTTIHSTSLLLARTVEVSLFIQLMVTLETNCKTIANCIVKQFWACFALKIMVVNMCKGASIA